MQLSAIECNQPFLASIGAQNLPFLAGASFADLSAIFASLNYTRSPNVCYTVVGLCYNSVMEQPNIPRVSLEAIDALPVANVSLDALDLDRVAAHIEQARAYDRYSGSMTMPLPFLHELRCVASFQGETVPTLAGLLMFGREPQVLLPHADVAVAHFVGVVGDLTQPPLHFQRYGGNLIQQIDEVEKYLWANTRRRIDTTNGPQRTERPEYPRRALRELIANAVTHRDYNVMGARSQVSMFVDRIEWRSPGGLPLGVTPDNIFSIGSTTRNPTIAQLLYQVGYIEAFGMGLRTVAALLAQDDHPPLEMRDTKAFFLVTMRGQQSMAELMLTPPRLAILRFAREHGRVSLEGAQSLAPNRSRRTVQIDLKFLVDQHFLRVVGQSRDRHYIPAEEMIELSGM